MLPRLSVFRMLAFMALVSLLVLSACAPTAAPAAAPAAGATDAPAAAQPPAAAAPAKAKTLTIAQNRSRHGRPAIDDRGVFLPLNVFDRLVEAVTTRPASPSWCPAWPRSGTSPRTA